MIAILNGTHETVTYKDLQGIRLWHNREYEDYPLHWHTALEIIMPFENKYTVMIDGKPHILNEGDIWITAPGTLHELRAPETGERLILLFDYSLICNVKGMDSLLQTIHPFLLVRRDYGDLNGKLRFYLEEISREYDYSEPYAEAAIYSLMIRFFVTLGRANINPQEMFPGITSASSTNMWINSWTSAIILPSTAPKTSPWTNWLHLPAFPSFILPGSLSSSRTPPAMTTSS